MIVFSLLYKSETLSVFLSEEDADLQYLNWSIRKDRYTYYVQRTIVDYPYEYNEVLHRTVLERKIGRSLIKPEKTDHRDQNGLNNTRENLRVATPIQNVVNSRDRKDTKLVRGVSMSRGKFRVRIQNNGVGENLGFYSTLEEAKTVYRKRHIQIHGEFSPYYKEPGL